MGELSTEFLELFERVEAHEIVQAEIRRVETAMTTGKTAMQDRIDKLDARMTRSSRNMEDQMTLKSAPTTRPDLIGKTVVDIFDPYPHGDGLVPPSAYLREIVVVEEDYLAIRELGGLQWMRGPESFRPIMRVWYRFDRLEPGERLDHYLPGASAILGTPDFIYFQGRQRKKWDREHRATPTGSS